VGDKIRSSLPNVWLGVSAEDQVRADERIPHLLATPAAARFVSLEPLLGAINLFGWLRIRELDDRCAGLDWVIVGGESGPGARPMHPDWARSLRDQCVDAGVPFFFKQWGEWIPGPGKRCFGTIQKAITMAHIGKKCAGRLLDGVEHNGMPPHTSKTNPTNTATVSQSKARGCM
jgi:protein gp37